MGSLLIAPDEWPLACHRAQRPGSWLCGELWRKRQTALSRGLPDHQGWLCGSLKAQLLAAVGIAFIPGDVVVLTCATGQPCLGCG